MKHCWARQSCITVFMLHCITFIHGSVQSLYIYGQRWAKIKLFLLNFRSSAYLSFNSPWIESQVEFICTPISFCFLSDAWSFLKLVVLSSFSNDLFTIIGLSNKKGGLWQQLPRFFFIKHYKIIHDGSVYILRTKKSLFVSL